MFHFHGRFTSSKDDFREEPPKGFFRLSPGKEVRLRYAYIIKCIDMIKIRRPEKSANCVALMTRKQKVDLLKAAEK